jgi:uncharacterized protein (DUF2147 family)
MQYGASRLISRNKPPARRIGPELNPGPTCGNRRNFVGVQVSYCTLSHAWAFRPKKLPAAGQKGMKTMRNYFLGIGASAVMVFAVPVSPRAASASFGNPVGTWLTEDGHGVVRIAPCVNGVCRAIVGFDQMPSEAIPRDVAGRSQCGLPILIGSVQSKNGVTEGFITDPRDGKVYNVRLWVSEGKLHVRGYFGIPLLGQTQVWQSFSGDIADGCRINKPIS